VTWQWDVPAALALLMGRDDELGHFFTAFLTVEKASNRALQTPSMPLVQWDLPCRIVSGPPRKSFLFYLNGCATLIK
jgi:hypothetical protein